MGGLVSTFLFLFVAGTTLGQPAPDDAAKQATDLLSQARPVLLQVMGQGSEQPLQVRAVGLEQLGQVPDPDLEACLHWHFADLGPVGLDRAVRALRLAKANVAVARYAEGEGLLYFVPGQQAAVARWDDRLSSAVTPAFLQLVLVHEAARQLLDARYNLHRLRTACRSPEDQQILQALIEGRTLWASRHVARKLGADASFPLLLERLRHVPDPDPDPGIRAAVQTALRQEHWAGETGLAFFTYLEEHGIQDAERRAFTRPPRQLAWLKQPEQYLRFDRPDQPDLASLLERVKAMPPGKDWRASTDVWTPDMVRAAAKTLGTGPQAERVLGSWVDGRLLLFTRAAEPIRMIAISLVRHSTVAGARAYYGFTLDMQRKEQQIGQGDAAVAVVVSSRSSAWQAAGLEEGARFDELLQIGNGEPLPRCLMFGRAGDLVVQLTWQGQAADADWAQGVVGAILDKASH
jgi:hypothetical protein